MRVGVEGYIIVSDDDQRVMGLWATSTRKWSDSSGTY
jgi:hypothetical protein